MTTSTQNRRIVIEPVTRVEGHGKVTILLDEERKVQQARLHIVEFRGFERFIQGRPFWEVPVLVQRLCGICPVSHHLAAAKAMDRIVGGAELTPTAHKMRLLMHHGQFLQSHALHFFHLCSPDLLFGFDADVEVRNVLGVAANFPDLARQGIRLRQYGQEIIQATAGKKIHGTGAVPGGVNKNLSIVERDTFLASIDQIVEWGQGALKLARDYTLENLEMLAPFGSWETSHLSLVRPDGAYDIYDGGLRARNPQGETIFDHGDNQRYHEFFTEEVRSWSYMKFPFIKSLGREKGWYRVGPLARVNNCDYFDTPLAEAARREFMGLTDGVPNQVTMAYHWARMIELVHSAETIRKLLHDDDLQGEDLMVKGEGVRETVGIIEAPRGTLFHHYRINADDQVEMANLIVSTTSNNEAMNRAVEKVARDHLSEVPELTEGLLNHVEVAIRAYDPCLSCATHAMGQMPLHVELFDHEGELVDRRIKE
ncbi:MAG: Ni/Fe hydrogenase subunit alpha [Candidatus Latescibacteria bacterium]|nr:Ni/Fe hydrogenase subunit alpha [Candidatus Latescibacterota bacterium]